MNFGMKVRDESLERLNDYSNRIDRRYYRLELSVDRLQSYQFMLGDTNPMPSIGEDTPSADRAALYDFLRGMR
jgi:hypothetical protein